MNRTSSFFLLPSSFRKGSALLIVLGMLSFMVVSAVGFSIYMRSSRTPSSYLRRNIAARYLVRSALAKAIEVIGRHGFNMRTLRSRPMRQLLWQYYFYVEAEGNIDSPEGERMLGELNAYCDRLKVLGTYVKND